MTAAAITGKGSPPLFLVSVSPGMAFVVEEASAEADVFIVVDSAVVVAAEEETVVVTDAEVVTAEVTAAAVVTGLSVFSCGEPLSSASVSCEG